MNQLTQSNTQILSKNGIPSPSGWLVCPARNLALLFITNSKHPKNARNITTQLWHCTIKGIPTKLKNTRKMDLESAIETWNELLNHGWEGITEQINNRVA